VDVLPPRKHLTLVGNAQGEAPAAGHGVHLQRVAGREPGRGGGGVAVDDLAFARLGARMRTQNPDLEDTGASPGVPRAAPPRSALTRWCQSRGPDDRCGPGPTSTARHRLHTKAQPWPKRQHHQQHSDAHGGGGRGGRQAILGRRNPTRKAQRKRSEQQSQTHIKGQHRRVRDGGGGRGKEKVSDGAGGCAGSTHPTRPLSGPHRRTCPE
jgi:hypothetical protein